MLVRYKKNKKLVFYDAKSLVTGNHPDPAPRTHGPFVSCGDCPYASPGFLCYTTEGDCMKTHMHKSQKKKERITE